MVLYGIASFDTHIDLFEEKSFLLYFEIWVSKCAEFYVDSKSKKKPQIK